MNTNLCVHESKGTSTPKFLGSNWGRWGREPFTSRARGTTTLKYVAQGTNCSGVNGPGDHLLRGSILHCDSSLQH